MESKSFRIISTEVLAQDALARITRVVIHAPDIARKAQAGQFVAVMVVAEGERIPLTIVETNEEAGTVTLIVQELGLSTRLLGARRPGESLFALAGPLGHPTPIKEYGHVIVVGGGVGVAEILPVARALARVGNPVTAVIGARTRELLILEKELSACCDMVRCATDDGSQGTKGFVTDVLTSLLATSYADTAPGLVYAVGPIPMMRAVSETTRPRHIKTTLSLNALMVDATGMCGSCRVTVGKAVYFSCVDGPEFDAHQVDWQELSARSKIYVRDEAHICKLTKLV